MSRVKEQIKVRPGSAATLVAGIIFIALAIAFLAYVAMLGFLNVALLEVITLVFAIIGVTLTGIGIGTMRMPVTAI